MNSRSLRTPMTRSELEHLIRAAGAIAEISSANTAGTTGLCLEVHDLAISKYAAGRHKDLEFTRELARHSLTDPRVLLDRLAKTPVSSAIRALIGGRIKSDARVRKT